MERQSCRRFGRGHGRRDKKHVHDDKRRRGQLHGSGAHGEFGNGIANIFDGRNGAIFANITRNARRFDDHRALARVFEMRGARIKGVRDLSEDQQERDPKQRFGRES